GDLPARGRAPARRRDRRRGPRGHPPRPPRHRRLSRRDVEDVSALLAVKDLDVLLGDYQVLWNARCAVAEGEIVALLGPNGAGKSTLMNAISGLVRPRAGEVVFAGRPITALRAHERVTHGISHVLERRRLFPYLTVRQNVWLGGYHRGARADREAQYQRM